jgi:hypothetical protein
MQWEIPPETTGVGILDKGDGIADHDFNGSLG